MTGDSAGGASAAGDSAGGGAGVVVAGDSAGGASAAGDSASVGVAGDSAGGGAGVVVAGDSATGAPAGAPLSNEEVSAVAALEDSLGPLGHRWREEPKNWWMGAPFIAMHLAPLAAIWTGVPWRDLVLCAVLYFVRMFFITAGYHRYFSHRSYHMGRVPQFLMAVGGITAVQKGPLWWAGHHREHHRYGDTERDPHSPLQGFWWSHVGWILSKSYKATNFEIIDDFAIYPELRAINRFQLAGPIALGFACWWFFGWAGVVVGFVWSTVLLWHGTFIVNSVTHLVGSRRYATPDTSRNSLIVALATNGEGWHNNHHHCPTSARQGFYWWEWDPSYYALWLLERVGVVDDLRRPPPVAIKTRRTGDGAFDIGMFRALLGKAARLSTSVGSQRTGVARKKRAVGASSIVASAAATSAAATSTAVAEAQRRLAEALAEVAARAKELTRASRSARERH